MDFAAGVDVPQELPWVDRDRVLLVVDPRKARPVIRRRDVRVHVVRKLLVAHPREAVPDVLELRVRGEMQGQEYGVEEGERRAERVADQRDGWARCVVRVQGLRDRIEDVDGGARMVFGEPFVHFDVLRDAGEQGGVEVGEGDVGVVQQR